MNFANCSEEPRVSARPGTLQAHPNTNEQPRRRAAKLETVETVKPQHRQASPALSQRPQQPFGMNRTHREEVSLVEGQQERVLINVEQVLVRGD